MSCDEGVINTETGVCMPLTVEEGGNGDDSFDGVLPVVRFDVTFEEGGNGDDSFDGVLSVVRFDVEGVVG